MKAVSLKAIFDVLTEIANILKMDIDLESLMESKVGFSMGDITVILSSDLYEYKLRFEGSRCVGVTQLHGLRGDILWYRGLPKRISELVETRMSVIKEFEAW